MGKRAADTVLYHAGHAVEVTWKDIKSLRLRVTPPDGALKASLPYHVDEEELRGFIDRNLGWIDRAQWKVRTAVLVREPVVDGGMAQLWGRCYETTTRTAARAGASIDGDVIELVGPDAAGLERALENLYRRELKAMLPQLLDYWEPRIQRSSSQIKLRRMKSRWGTCNTRTGAITLNTALAERPVEYLEYVLVHELVHLWEPNHGPAFKAWMDFHLPGWRARRSALRGN